LLPAATVVGTAVLVVIRSAWVASATTSAAVALLFAKLGSVVEEVTVAVSLIAVPGVAVALTVTATEKLAVPTAKLGLVQVMVPVLPRVG